MSSRTRAKDTFLPSILAELQSFTRFRYYLDLDETPRVGVCQENLLWSIDPEVVSRIFKDTLLVQWLTETFSENFTR